MERAGQVLAFTSPVDGLEHPFAIAASREDGEPMPLVVEVSPGAINDLAAAAALCEEIVEIAERNGRECIALRPTGRGPGSVYQDYGEVDVMEAIEFAASLYPIDRDRISITGVSMGGAATWYLASHYPDLFAAAAPFCGYADHRLWEKPGGTTFPMRDWEEPSWRARSAALLIENLERTPVWIVHGEWDRAIGGGVSVEHSRLMARLLRERGHEVTYTELPRTGHNARVHDVWEQVVVWLLDQRKRRDPERIAFATGTLRHNRSDWLRIEQLVRYGQRGAIDAGFADDGLDVRTDNVRTFTIAPGGGRRARTEVRIDGEPLGALELADGASFRREPGGRWHAGSFDLSQEKQPGRSGPVGDLFFERTLLVTGTAGLEAETFFNDWAADDAAAYFRMRNGGVHRGGILGQNTVELPVVRDVDLTDADLATANLVLYGTPASNAVLARMAPQIPLRFDSSSLVVGDRAYRDPYAAIFAIFPNPTSPAHYVAVHGGASADAISWGSHLDLALLPDFIVYARGEVLDWGFWGNGWRAQG